MSRPDGERPLPPAEVVASIERGLQAHADPERAVRERAYLKSELVHLGASVPAIRRVAVEVDRRAGGLDREDLFGAVALLWDTGVHECRMAGVELLNLHAAELGPEDLPTLGHYAGTARTWALVDGLAVGIVGDIVERHPKATEAVLDGWAADPDLWLRRTALLAHLGPLRRGRGSWERFTRYADAMLDEREFFIRKAIGWVLREVGKQRPALVTAWVEPRTQRVSGVTVREAVRWLPPDDRERLLAAYRARRRVS